MPQTFMDHIVYTRAFPSTRTPLGHPSLNAVHKHHPLHRILPMTRAAFPPTLPCPMGFMRLDSQGRLIPTESQWDVPLNVIPSMPILALSYFTYSTLCLMSSLSRLFVLFTHCHCWKWKGSARSDYCPWEICMVGDDMCIGRTSTYLWAVLLDGLEPAAPHANCLGDSLVIRNLKVF